jgi:predicted anti-sigma-YlaC factor YlaD
VEKIECDVMVERSTEYLEGALAGNDLTQVIDHLHVCPACEIYLDEVRVTMRLASELPPEPMSEALEATLLAKYREWIENVA